MQSVIFFSCEILEINVNPKTRAKVITTTFRAEWEVTNTGEKEFGSHIGLKIVKGNYLTLVDGNYYTNFRYFQITDKDEISNVDRLISTIKFKDEAVNEKLKI